MFDFPLRIHWFYPWGYRGGIRHAETFSLTPLRLYRKLAGTEDERFITRRAVVQIDSCASNTCLHYNGFRMGA